MAEEHDDDERWFSPSVASTSTSSLFTATTASATTIRVDCDSVGEAARANASMTAEAVFFVARPHAVNAGGAVSALGSRPDPAMRQFVVDHGFVVRGSAAKSGGGGGSSGGGGDGAADDASTAAAAAAATPSHYMYDGLYGMGKLRVPPGVPTEGFAAAIVADFARGVFGAITENKPLGGACKLYFDYDWEVDEWPSEELWARVEAAEKQVVCRFFPEVDARDPLFDAMVLASGVRRVVGKRGNHVFRAGIHVVYANLLVDVERALYISAALLAKLDHDMPAAPGVWQSRVDQAVYAEGRGLRWAWQFKTKQCEACGGGGGAGTSGSSSGFAPGGGAAGRACAPDPVPLALGVRKAKCGVCTRGRVADPASSMYAPVYCVDGCGIRRAVASTSVRAVPTVALLLAASIRPAVAGTPPTEGFVLFAGAPGKPVIAGRSARTVHVKDATAETARASRAGTLVPYGDPRFDVLQGALRRVDPMYSQLCIKLATQTKLGFKVLVKGVGARYCLNAQGDHTCTQDIVFLVTHRGVIQCCNCMSPKVRTTGCACKAFRSSAKPLLHAEQLVLFGSSGPESLHGARTVPGPSFKVPPAVASVLACRDSSSGANSAGAGAGAGTGMADAVAATASSVIERLANAVPEALGAMTKEERLLSATATFLNKRPRLR